MNIIGAGMAGLLAGHALRHHKPVIWEVQKGLPNNHSAVLRFRTQSVADITNIPFRKVQMVKCTLQHLNPVASVLAYSKKNTGVYRSNRSINSGTEVGDRWIAPPDFIPRMAEGLNIKYGQSFNFAKLNSGPTISTIPMPSLMRRLNYPQVDKIKFESTPGINIKAQVPNSDAFVSLIVPDPKLPYSRVSLCGPELTVEAPLKNNKMQMENFAKFCLSSAIALLGLQESELEDIEWREQAYAKIVEIDDVARKNFLFWATDNFNIFALGRFATWRPHILLDDLVNDLRRIDGWINSGRYSIARSR
jgi:hypothetical protein